MRACDRAPAGMVRAVIVAGAVALALAAQPAPAVEVAHLGLGSEFGAPVVGPDGGAWVPIDRSAAEYDRGESDPDDALGRAMPDGTFRVAAVDGRLSPTGAVLGPDGQAWFPVGLSIDRFDAAGNLTRSELPQPLGDVAATGPDGTLWSADARAGRLLRVNAQGAVTSARLKLPACEARSFLQAMQTAADGAVWIADGGCSRMIRLAPDGTAAVHELADDERPLTLAPDRAGGIWFSGDSIETRVGHIDAAGTIRRWPTPERYGPTRAIAAGPGWDRASRVRALRARAGRSRPAAGLRRRADPGPDTSPSIPSGGLWLASASRLVHAPSSPRCLEACATTSRPRSGSHPRCAAPSRLARLRRGIRISVRQPATISATGDYGQDDHDWRLRIVRVKAGGSLVFRLPRGQLKRYERLLAAGRRPEISLYAQVYDRDGNIGQVEQEAIPVTR